MRQLLILCCFATFSLCLLYECANRDLKRSYSVYGKAKGSVTLSPSSGPLRLRRINVIATKVRYLRGGGWSYSPWSDFLQILSPRVYNGIVWMDAMCPDEGNWTHIVMLIPVDEKYLQSKNFDIKFKANWLYVAFKNPDSGSTTVVRSYMTAKSRFKETIACPGFM